MKTSREDTHTWESMTRRGQNSMAKEHATQLKGRLTRMPIRRDGKSFLGVLYLCITAMILKLENLLKDL